MVCMILSSSFCSLSRDSKLCFSSNKCVRGFGRFVAFTVLSVQGVSLWTTTCDSLRGSASAAVRISTLYVLSCSPSDAVSVSLPKVIVVNSAQSGISFWNGNHVEVTIKFICVAHIISNNLVTHFYSYSRYVQCQNQNYFSMTCSAPTRFLFEHLVCLWQCMQNMKYWNMFLCDFQWYSHIHWNIHGFSHTQVPLYPCAHQCLWLYPWKAYMIFYAFCIHFFIYLVSENTFLTFKGLKSLLGEIGVTTVDVMGSLLWIARCLTGLEKSMSSATGFGSI